MARPSALRAAAASVAANASRDALLLACGFGTKSPSAEAPTRRKKEERSAGNASANAARAAGPRMHRLRARQVARESAF